MRAERREPGLQRRIAGTEREPEAAERPVAAGDPRDAQPARADTDERQRQHRGAVLVDQ